MPSSQMGHAGAPPLQSNLLQLAENRLHLLRGDVASGVVDDVFQRDGAGHRQHGVAHHHRQLAGQEGLGPGILQNLSDSDLIVAQVHKVFPFPKNVSLYPMWMAFFAFLWYNVEKSTSATKGALL